MRRSPVHRANDSRLSRRSRRPGDKPRAAAAGISALEVLVIVSIFGLLASLVTPAIQLSRERARRLQCANNLREMLGVFHAVLASERKFPGARFHHDVANYLGAPVDRHEFPKSPLFACPSDPESTGDTRGNRQNYHMNAGSDSRVRNQGFAQFGRFGPEKFRDGLSHTAALGERLAWPPLEGRVLPWDEFPHWWIRRLRDTAVRHDDLDAFADECEHRALRPLKTWYDTGPFYHHTLLPNRNSCINESLNSNLLARTATSFHPGGVNIALADGHVRFISDGIDRAVWRALGNRDSDTMKPAP